MTDELRTCRKCGRTLPAASFKPGGVNTNGRAYVSHVCKACDKFRRDCQKARPLPTKGQTRECKVCHAVKPLSEFHMDNRGGRVWTCKRCDVAKKNERIQRRKVTDPEWYAGYLQRARESIRRNRIRLVLSAVSGGQS